MAHRQLSPVNVATVTSQETSYAFAERHLQRSTKQLSAIRRLRVAQIRALASFFNRIGRWRWGSRMIVRLRANIIIRSLTDSALGYRRTFSSFAEAQARASSFIEGGHEHPDDFRFHISISNTLRESDYPVLFHLAPLAPKLRSVFDLGGHVGNVLYAYQTKVTFPSDLIWTIYDLPAKKLVGEKLAAERQESRIRYSDRLNDASGADVFIASGSLHYFEQSLEELLRPLPVLPTHVFVNRTPLSIGEELFTVQDARSYLVPCKLHSIARMLRGMERLGYELVEDWPVHELSLNIPLYPDHVPRTYFGFYFKREGWRP